MSVIDEMEARCEQYTAEIDAARQKQIRIAYRVGLSNGLAIGLMIGLAIGALVLTVVAYWPRA